MEIGIETHVYISETHATRPTRIVQSFPTPRHLVAHAGFMTNEIRDYFKDEFSQDGYSEIHDSAAFDAVFGAERVYSIQSQSSWKGFTFVQLEPKGTLLYTHKALAIGSTFAIVCVDAFTDGSVEVLRGNLKDKTLIEIDATQMDNFCADVVEVQLQNNKKKAIVLSKRALQAFKQEQLAVLKEHTSEIIALDMETIESLFQVGLSQCVQVLHKLRAGK